MLRVEQKLSSGIQLPYNATVTKSFSVEIGHEQSLIDITLKSEFQTVLVILHRNSDALGSLDSNLLLWKPHGLVRAYLETGVQIRYSTFEHRPQYDT